MRSLRRRRAPRRYSRRERYPQEGMLLQIDGSRHDWLQGRGPHPTLVGAVDDATGTVPFALFRQQEDAHGYMLMLKGIINRHGVPLALYNDRHGLFQRSPKEPESLDEQLRGRRDPTQFGRALEELDIRLTMAHTPQAKGRIERAWDTFQDRLVSELRLAGVKTIEQANQVLWNSLARYNQRFGVAPAQPGSAYRQLPAGVSLDAVLSFKYLRTVATTTPSDSTAPPSRYCLMPTGPPTLALTWKSRNGGSIVVTHQGRTLAAEPAPVGPVELRARSGRRSSGQLPDVTGASSNGPLSHTQQTLPPPKKTGALSPRIERLSPIGIGLSMPFGSRPNSMTPSKPCG